MPGDASVLGFSNPWYPEVLRSARAVDIAEGLTIRLVSAAAFLATKYAAFVDPTRGGGDYVASRDLEYIIALVDGRPELDQELHDASAELRGYLGRALRDLLGARRFREALPGHLPGDPAGQARMPRIVDHLRRWADHLPERKP